MLGGRSDRRPGIASRLNLAIHDARADDWSFIEALGKRTVMDSVSTLRHPLPALVHANFGALVGVVRDRPHRAFIAEADGRPAGFLLLLDSLPDEVTGEDQAFVAYMAVEPGLRRSGVGTALLLRAEDEARRRGAPYISLMVTEENAAARELYEGAGYVIERRLLCKAL
jgi:ribosomal protein S18 acetylase RimI-like enzyme